VPALRLVLGDQLTASVSALQDADRSRDIVVMFEVAQEATYVRHHKQKIVLVLSAMRHFAEELRADGFTVDYVELEHPQNTGSITGELRRAVMRHRAQRVVATEPGEWRVREMMQSWEPKLGVPVEIREDTRFLCSRQEFAAWAEGKRQLRMESFYRLMRKRTGWLMDGGSPEGGSWNFDAENRRALPAGIPLPAPLRFAPNEATRKVIDLVAQKFPDHFGELQTFGWAVTRGDAKKALRHFVTNLLPRFGDYQDAMKSGHDFLFHSTVSPYLNLGLLTPREVCGAALKANRTGEVPLNAVEGFVRQILGWREYVRGIYWLKMPAYEGGNFFEIRRALPGFYWTGDTRMSCVRHVVDTTRRNAYAHHIQRLMVTGNFALLAGIDPKAVEEWYLAVYADAYEWVELPNTHGMALYADGGLLASKPYAASGAYINRMSNYCGGCQYDPKAKTGTEACPFNYLYWDFLIRNRERLRSNPRMALPYRGLDRMDPSTVARMMGEAAAFLASLERGGGT
jgi:deoxyribodipyrimidine photolyase-related protein